MCLLTTSRITMQQRSTVLEMTTEYTFSRKLALGDGFKSEFDRNEEHYTGKIFHIFRRKTKAIYCVICHISRFSCYAYFQFWKESVLKLNLWVHLGIWIEWIAKTYYPQSIYGEAPGFCQQRSGKQLSLPVDKETWVLKQKPRTPWDFCDAVHVTYNRIFLPQVFTNFYQRNE